MKDETLHLIAQKYKGSYKTDTGPMLLTLTFPPSKRPHMKCPSLHPVHSPSGSLWLSWCPTALAFSNCLYTSFLLLTII